MAAESRAAVLAALLGNGALAVLKGISAALTGSAAMLAETFHSIADTGNQALLFLGMRLGKRPPDADHPFGHGKNVYFWAFVVSVMLFSLGGAFSIGEGVRKWLHPAEEAGGASWAFAVLAGGFVFETISLGVALRSLWQAKGEETVAEYWRETRDPTLVTVVLEDSAALLSLVVAAVGLTLVQVTGSSLWDAVASAIIGAMLIGVAIVLALESYSLLIGESAPRDTEARVRGIVTCEAAVDRLVSLKTLYLGPRSMLTVLQVEFQDGLSTREIQAAVERVQGSVASAFRRSTSRDLVIVEPSTRRARDARAA